MPFSLAVRERHQQSEVEGPNRCLLLSANLKQAQERLDNLLAYIRTLKKLPDIIAIQDPPPSFAFTTCKHYSHWYRSADDYVEELSSDNNPRNFPYEPSYSRIPPPKNSSTDLVKVAFLIRDALPAWNVTEHEPEDSNRGILAALHLPTIDGSIAFHNLYNRNNKVDIEALTESCRGYDEAHWLLGDFNLHHNLWGGD